MELNKALEDLLITLKEVNRQNDEVIKALDCKLYAKGYCDCETKHTEIDAEEYMEMIQDQQVHFTGHNH